MPLSDDAGQSTGETNCYWVLGDQAWCGPCDQPPVAGAENRGPATSSTPQGEIDDPVIKAVLFGELGNGPIMDEQGGPQ